jgi:glycosyltransferase involved in cell wall biosynthesis
MTDDSQFGKPGQDSSQENDLRQVRLQQAVQELKSRVSLQENQIHKLASTLNEIQGSRAWKLVQFLWRIRLTLVPDNSLQARLINRLLRRHPLQPPSLAPVGQVTIPSGTTPGQGVPLQNETISPMTPGQTISFARDDSGITEAARWPEDRYAWPLISVILPIYNHADMLLQAARSVLASTYPRLELIILNDGSQDEIESVLDGLLTDGRVRVFRQPNQKLPRALTNAHAFARGKWVTWTSADNLMGRQALETLANALLGHPEAVLAYADVAIIDETGQPVVDGSYRPRNMDDTSLDVMRLYRSDLPLGYEPDNYINACFLYRREASLALESYYADDLRGLEDYDFWLRMQKIGKFVHVKNEVPLYYYRVHARTMSHELLTRESQAHFARMNKLLDYESQRRDFIQKRWIVALDEAFSLPDKEAISDILAQLPVDVVPLGKEIKTRSKVLPYVSSDHWREAPLRVYPDLASWNWRLEWISPRNGEQQTLKIWRGINVHPLALKARDHHKDILELPGSATRRVLGCHLGFGRYPVDIPTLRRIIAGNPDVLFAFIDIVGASNQDVGTRITNGFANAAYLGERNFGEIYSLYAHFDVVWLPPAQGQISESVYRESLALAYAIARPLLAPFETNFIPAPYQFIYYPAADNLEFAKLLDRKGIDTDLLNHYIDLWTPPASFSQLLRFCNAISLERVVPRPDFGIPSLPVTRPKPWKQPEVKQEGFKVMIAVDSLDTGGLEGVIVQLVRGMPPSTVDVFVLCTQQGGLIASQLRREGFRVYEANGQMEAIEAVFRTEKPALVNSHHACKALLEAARQAGAPVIETIHNTYVWFDQRAWQEERERSKLFDSAIAVSQLVKAYYAHWNPAFPPEKITMVGNGVDASRLAIPPRHSARQACGFEDGDYVFLSLTRYETQKNLIGILTAFNEIACQYPQARLVCAGHSGDPVYFEGVLAYRDELPTKDHIQLHGYRKDTNLLLAAADAFLLDSFFEGWSLAATEALMAGIPLIHSECGSAQELVGLDGERGFMVPNPTGDPLALDPDRFFAAVWKRQQPNKDALVQAMAQMISGDKQWKEKKAEIQKFAGASFGLQTFIEAYLRQFRTVLSENGS